MMRTYESSIGKADTKGKSSRTIIPIDVIIKQCTKLFD
jgi:hypothetical protein